MCFSATASFGVGAALLPTSAYCLNIALRRNRRFVPLALIPAFFGLQQIAEGVVWVGLRQENEAVVRDASLAYLFFAFSFWPFWIPLTATCMVTRPPQQRALGLLTALGAGWFFVMAGPLLWDSTCLGAVVVRGHSIDYDVSRLPILQVVSRHAVKLLYIAFVFVPFAFGTQPQFRLFGILLGTSAVVSQVVFAHAFVSVWCFFAAFLSLYLCVIFDAVCVPVEEASTRSRKLPACRLPSEGDATVA